MRLSSHKAQGRFVAAASCLLFALVSPAYSRQAQQPPQTPPDCAAKTPAKPDDKSADDCNKDAKDSKDPQAPNTATSGSAQPTVQTPQQPQNQQNNSRIFGVMPNYSTVENVNLETLKPISTKEKFKEAIEGSVDPYEFVIVGIVAAKDFGLRNYPDFGEGIQGYAKDYGVDFGNQFIGNVMTGAVFPSMLRTDPRYFQLGKGGFPRRFGYAFKCIFVTRTDAGHYTFNVSEFAGNAVATGISNAYLVGADRTLKTNADTFATQVAVDLVGNELKEFWPDIRRAVLKK
jgi:hypothetical protein